MSADVILRTPVQSTDADGRATLSIEATATIPTTFMRVLGFDEVTVSASTEVTRDIIGLDAVLSMDLSGSMEETAGGTKKITAAREAALNFLDAIYGEGDVDFAADHRRRHDLRPDPYRLRAVEREDPRHGRKLERGREDDGEPGRFRHQPDHEFDPEHGLLRRRRAGRYSPVPLLMDPAALPGGWSGCIYARYLGDIDSSGIGVNNNDADVVRGQVELGSKDWYGWEPMAVREAEPRSGNWGATDGEPSGSRWRGAPRRCYNSYVNDTSSSYRDNANGTIKGATGAIRGSRRPSRNTVVSSPADAAPGSARLGCRASASVSGKYSALHDSSDQRTEHRRC